MHVARRYLVSGRVQGVGFRYFISGAALQLRLEGWTRNLADGRVEVLVQGDEEGVDAIRTHLAEGPPSARVEKIESSVIPVDQTLTTFEVRH